MEIPFQILAGGTNRILCTVGGSTFLGFHGRGCSKTAGSVTTQMTDIVG